MLVTLRKHDGTSQMDDIPFAAEVVEIDGDYYVRPEGFVYGMPQPVDYTEASFIHLPTTQRP